ncbi:MAG: RluA family pseudouridine synthase [Immundisolibacterales bacterium]|nr:RluA family pseudouridine synthase [Immundisolibacterales bacterium]
MRYVLVDGENDGRRIDNFLHSQIPMVPRDRLYRLLRRGEVRVDGARVRASRRLRTGEQVRIPPLAPAPSRARSGRRPSAGDARLDEAIVYEDDRLLVLNKPSGLAVHGGSGVAYGVIELLRSSRPSAPYLELAHRLDRETSGCLIVAKRRSTLRALHEGLRGRSLEKRYVALLGGAWKGTRRRVNLPLERSRLSGGERMVRVSGTGRDSLTDIAAVAVGGGVTLVEALLHTGRTHQIRVHCAALDHPVAGDEKYGDRSLNRRLRASGLKRLFLHAASVRIHGQGLPDVTVRAGLDPALVGAAVRLGIPATALNRFQRGAEAD